MARCCQKDSSRNLLHIAVNSVSLGLKPSEFWPIANAWPEMVDNVIPYIGGEEEKSEKEPMKIWGHIEGDHIEPATSPVISAHLGKP